MVTGVLLVFGLFPAAPLFAASSTAGSAAGDVGLLWLVPVASIAAILYVVGAIVAVLRKEEGSPTVRRIALAIRTGAYAYLRQQYRVVGIFFAVMFVLLLVLSFQLHLLSVFVPFAFLSGGFFSGLTGYIGMTVATRANSRTAWACRDGLNAGLRVAITAGSVMGMSVVGLGLLDLSAWFYGLRLFKHMDLATLTQTMLTFEMGASSMALFARVGGGIYTKSADVGADIVGKVEQGIPEDDARNPATIADNVGDNVGDVAGMGADLYESYVGSIVATMALGAIAFPKAPVQGVTIPLVIAALGVFASLLSTTLVRTRKENASQSVLLAALRRGVYASSLLILAGSAWVVWVTLGPSGMGVFWAIAAGLVAGNLIGYSTEFFTSDSYGLTRELAVQAQTGPATLIIGGLANGMLSTVVAVVVVGATTLFSFFIAGGGDLDLGLYGVAVSAIGLLSTLGITLSSDAYGPVADNAGGIAQMAGNAGGLGPEVRERTDALDSLGNTTAATGKGFAIASAALTALALLAAFRDEAASLLMTRFSSFGETVSTELITPAVIVGLFLGGVTPFLFCSLTMKAVGRAANEMVEEVRRQFRQHPDILTGEVDPDYARCVLISTKGAQREVILPGVVAVAIPLAVGTFFGLHMLLGLISGALVTGFPLAVMMANSGGAWDNAKKFIESGHFGGKGGESHKAAVVGDTVGDPFKDTSGPSLNILLKLMSMVSVVFAAAMIAANHVLGIFH